MNKIYYTIQELGTLRFYELPNTIYNAIMADIERVYRHISPRLREILNNATVINLEQLTDIYKYIHVL